MKKIYYSIHQCLSNLKTAKIFFTIFLSLAFAISSVNAQTITLTTNIDEVNGNTANIAALIATPGGAGISLREAIIATNNEPGTATVTINVPGGDYQLTLTGASEDLAATGDLDLHAGGIGEMKTIHIIGTNPFSHITGMSDRIFDLHPNMGAGSITFNMTGMFLSNGTLTTGSGAAILAGKPGDIVSLINCSFANNQAAANGGAISQSSGLAIHSLTIANCSFGANIALTGAGGAINYSGLGTVSITNTRFTQNTAGTQGGAVNLTGIGAGPTMCTLTENTFSQNTANGATFGGAAIGMVNIVAITANYNRIVRNTAPNVATGKLISTGGGIVGSMNFNNNWWGVNTGPAGATDILGTLPTEWLQLKNTGSPASICNIGSTTTVTASFLSNNLSNPIAVADLDAVIGGPVNFQNPVNGTLTAAQTSIQPNGTATVTFTATALGNGTVEARYFATEEDFISITNPAITIVSPPDIGVGQPAPSNVCPGGNTSFTVIASGGGLTYQWRRGVTVLANGVQGSGSTMSGVSTATLNITNVQAADAATDYNVVVSNACGSIISDNTALSMNAAPVVLTSPMNSTVGNGGSTSFTASFSGTPTPTLQWRVSTTGVGGVYSPVPNSAPYSGVTTGTLIINPATLAMDGYYYLCVATNLCTPAATTTAALLTVTPGPTSSVLSATGATTICSGSSTTLAVTITGGTSPYTVVINRAPGGNFTTNNYVSGTNISVSPTATTTYSIVSVTDALSNIGTGNSGMPMITVNPVPNAVATPPSQTVCSGVPINTIALSGAIGGTTYNWTRDNTVNVTGIATPGSGNISGTLTNTTNTPQTVTFTITPTANGCPGPSITATVLVNPTPNAVATPASQTVCSANPITTIVLTGNVGGTTYNWTRDNTVNVTGIATPGSGNISGTLSNTTNVPQTVTFTITPTANGCPGPSITATVLVNPTPNAVATPASQTICSANPITTIVLSGSVSGTTYAWTRNNTVNVTGIATPGSGNISGTLTNTTNVPQTVTFTITPTANGCPGPSITATVLVNPTPNAVATPASQTICNNTAITTIVLSSSVAGTTYAWTRNNTVNVTGIATPGSGNISGTLTNITNVPQTVTFTITPTANGCPGPTTTATVTVAPTPTVDPVANQTVCNGTMTAPVNFTGPVAGTVFNWTNNTPSIGLAASGTGNIAAFTATNTTINPVTATVTVTPSVSVASQPTPELFHYKFDGSGTSVPNLASAPPSGTATATIIGGQTQGGSGLCDGTLIGSGNSSATNFVNTGWATNLTGTSWSISFKTSNITPSTTLFYVLGDNLAGNFRCFTNGVAGANNWMLRGPQGDIIATGGATVAPHTTTFVYDNTAGQLSAYVDGVLVNTRAQAPSTIAGAGPFKVGAQGTNTGLSAGGLMDEFRLYNRALTLSEIQSLSICNTICTGPTRTFTITVNPTPTITCPANITAASVVGGCTAVVNYTVPVTGTPTPTVSYVLTGATTGSGAGTGTGTAFRVGVTTVTVTAMNICATVTCSFTVTVTDSQLPTITTQPANRTLCVGGTATFSVAAVTAPTAGGTLSYQWQIWNGTAWVSVTGATGTTTNTMTLSNVTHSMNTNSYRVQLIGLCTTVNSNFATLFVNPLPTITLTTSIPPALIPTQVLAITATPSSAGGSYVWSKNGVVIGGATSSILNNLTVNDLGTYSVVYTDANGCVVTSSNIVITALQSQNLYVYPVPNRGVFNVRFYNQTNEEVTIRVFDTKGSEVYQRKMSTTQPYTTMIVDLTTGRILTSGTYIVEVRGAGGRLVGTRKIIVQN